jgi:hypothetical protein
MNPTVALVAYAGTGKDTLVNELRGGRLSLSSGEPEGPGEPRWVVYGPPSAALLARRVLPQVFSPANTAIIRRYAFADALKVETHEWLRLRGCPADAFENVKNTLQCPHPLTGELATMRGHYIGYGQLRRRDDPLVWARIVAQSIAREKFSQGVKRGHLGVVTDFRFDNELLPLHAALRESEDEGIEHDPAAAFVLTMRLYREEVKVAPQLEDRRIDSEHNLDEYRTHFLLVPPGQFMAAAKVFPQYAQYEPLWYAVAKK